MDAMVMMVGCLYTAFTVGKIRLGVILERRFRRPPFHVWIAHRGRRVRNGLFAFGACTSVEKFHCALRTWRGCRRLKAKSCVGQLASGGSGGTYFICDI